MKNSWGRAFWLWEQVVRSFRRRDMLGVLERKKEGQDGRNTMGGKGRRGTKSGWKRSRDQIMWGPAGHMWQPASRVVPNDPCLLALAFLYGLLPHWIWSSCVTSRNRVWLPRIGHERYWGFCLVLCCFGGSQQLCPEVTQTAPWRVYVTRNQVFLPTTTSVALPGLWVRHLESCSQSRLPMTGQHLTAASWAIAEPEPSSQAAPRFLTQRTCLRW